MAPDRKFSITLYKDLFYLWFIFAFTCMDKFLKRTSFLTASTHELPNNAAKSPSVRFEVGQGHQLTISVLAKSRDHVALLHSWTPRGKKSAGSHSASCLILHLFASISCLCSQFTSEVTSSKWLDQKVREPEQKQKRPSNPLFQDLDEARRPSAESVESFQGKVTYVTHIL